MVANYSCLPVLSLVAEEAWTRETLGSVVISPEFRPPGG